MAGMKGKMSAAEAAIQPLQQAVQAARRLCQTLSGAAGRVQAELGITASMRAVLDALHAGGPRTVPRIAREQGVSRQHVQVVVNALLAAGMVESADNPDHLRSPLLRLSGAGARACEALRRSENRLLADVAKRISGGDLKVTLKTLNALESGMDRAEARTGSRV